MRFSFLGAALIGACLFGNSVSAQTSGSVTVLHGVPGLSQDVDVYANQQRLFSFGYGEQRGPLSLPPASYNLEVRLKNTPILKGQATVAAGMSYSVIAHLDENGTPQLSVFANMIGKAQAGNARVTVRHTAQAPAVDVQVLRNDVQVAKPGGLANGKEVVAELPAGSYVANLFVANTNTKAFGPAPLDLDAGTAYVVYAVGEALKPSFRLLVEAIPVGNISALTSEVRGTSCGGRIWVSDPSPRVATPFDVQLFGAEPLGLALLNLGFDDKNFGSLGLPLDLGALGATGCSIYNDIVVLMATTTDIAGDAKMGLEIPAFIEAQLHPVFFQWWYPVDSSSSNTLGFEFSDQLVVRRR